MSLHTKLKVLILTIMSSLVFTIPANALEYQTDPITLDFTFGSVLSISTDGDITIPSLTPGTKSISDSNYKVIVSTNNTTGYTLAATVGCSSGANCYNTKNLVDSNNDDTTTNNFTMIDSATTLTTPGTWGISLDSTADENSTFDTLPLYSSTAKIINQTTSTTGTAAIGYAGTNNTTMRIGAYATTSQLAGTYTNTINFIAVANTVPMLYMQDLTSSTIATLLPNINNTATVYDKRDGQSYTIAKLADNKYWMVTNLNLAGGIALDADKTDVDSSYISSFTTSNNLTKTGSTIVLPASSTGGFNQDNYAFVYNSGSTTCGNKNPCCSYYSWDAATQGSGRNISTDNTNAPYSICPKGWRLPTTYNGSGTTAEATDFRALMIALGGSNSIQSYTSSTSPTGATIYNQLVASPYNFLLAGYYFNGSFSNGGSGGGYWSATSNSSSTSARSLLFSSTGVYSADYGSRYYGFSVRCVFGG